MAMFPMRFFLLLSFLLVSNASAGPKSPNVLFILTDNQPASIVGSYGNPDVRTPNIDQLASEGMQFSNAFAVNGMCSPTRATLMTGLMPSQHGVHNWLDDEKMQDWPRDWSAVAEFRTLP
ncbi:MAG: sulfatase-like hydrolase/transferase, partial [Pseudomonadales bacterium]